MSSINFHNCDNMEFMKNIPDKFYDLAIVDPPYGLERFKNGIGKNNRHKVKSSSILNNNPPTNIYFDELFRISKNQIIWGANNFTLPPSEYFCIWDKKQTVDNFATAEYAWVSMGLKTPAKIFEYSIHLHNHTNKIHPTQKPVQLYKWLLTKYAKQGDKILDTHGGSMSIAIACHDLEFDLDLCELDKDYFDAGVKRFEQHKKQLKLF